MEPARKLIYYDKRPKTRYKLRQLRYAKLMIALIVTLASNESQKLVLTIFTTAVRSLATARLRIRYT